MGLEWFCWDVLWELSLFPKLWGKVSCCWDADKSFQATKYVLQKRRHCILFSFKNIQWKKKLEEFAFHTSILLTLLWGWGGSWYITYAFVDLKLQIKWRFPYIDYVISFILFETLTHYHHQHRLSHDQNVAVPID